MRIVDFHAHAFADSLAPKAIPALEARGDLTARYDGTVADLLEAMNRNGVAVSVIQPVATRPGQVAVINDWAASLASDRIVAFGAMHPDLPDPAAEMTRMRELGLKGFKLHPEHQEFAPDDPRMAAIYSSAVEHDMIVLFHAGADVIHETVRGAPEAFARVIDAWPDLTAVLAHLGGFREWEGVAEHLVGRDVWLDTAYTLGHLPDAEFVRMVRAHGVDRVLFGSDGPWTDSAEEIALLRSSGLTGAELEAVLGLNAERLLGL
ncbi:MAG: amidohydrolase family protein [Anaerosomatales bacterium]|nr:amidohydrolase family protein [Anaerosomatales bacterium]MDT8434581.1 amidohydrolase family protein [Anaerosomatales bacterium]